MLKFFREILYPLDTGNRKSFLILILLAFLGMFVAVIGVGSVLPIVAIALDEDYREKYPVIADIQDLANIGTREEVLIAAMGAFFVLIFLKAVISLFVLIRQKKLNANIRAAVTDSLFRHLMNSPLTFHRGQNSGKLLRNLTADISSHGRALQDVITIIVEGLMTLGILFILFLADPAGLMVMSLVVVTTAWGYMKILQPRLARWGKRVRKAQAKILMDIQHGLGAIKEIKILGREHFFSTALRSSMRESLDFQRKFSVAQALPVNLLEVLIASGAVIIVYSFLARGGELDDLVPILALFMASAIRLGPSLSRLAAAFQSLRFQRPGVSALCSSLMENHLTLSAEQLSDPAVLTNERAHCPTKWTTLQLQDLEFSYVDKRNFALGPMNLKMERGTSLGIFGDSGSGKTTLMDIFLGLNLEYRGEVWIDQNSLKDCSKEWQSQIGYVPQDVYLLDDTLRRNIALGIPERDIDQERLASAVQKAQLTSFVNGLDHGLDSVVGERGARISGGQQQRVGIARALYREPSVLVFDEATSALDLTTEREFMNVISEMCGAVTMIIIAHRLSTLEFCDQLIQLRDGQIVRSGSYQDLVGSSK